MFFVKALGGGLAAVFGALYLTGFFGPVALFGPSDPAEMRAELHKRDMANSVGGKWGLHCDRIRDEALGLDNGIPAGGMPAAGGSQAASGIRAVAKVHAMDAKLRKAGCDVNAAPSAFSPFDPQPGEFREPNDMMSSGGGVPDGSQWGNEPVFGDPTEDNGWGAPK